MNIDLIKIYLNLINIKNKTNVIVIKVHGNLIEFILIYIEMYH